MYPISYPYKDIEAHKQGVDTIGNCRELMNNIHSWYNSHYTNLSSSDGFILPLTRTSIVYYQWAANSIRLFHCIELYCLRLSSQGNTRKSITFSKLSSLHSGKYFHMKSNTNLFRSWQPWMISILMFSLNHFRYFPFLELFAMELCVDWASLFTTHLWALSSIWIYEKNWRLSQSSSSEI